MSPIFLSLGDSMSIDDYAGGEGRGAASLLHRNLDAEFPEWAGRDLRSYGFNAQLLARDGATTADVLEHQLPLVDTAPNLVTITMGGNDLLSVFGNDNGTERAIYEVAATGAAVLRDLRRVAGSSCPIVLTTVYDPSDGTGNDGQGTPVWPNGPALLRRLNETLAQLAGHYGATLARVDERFLGHGVNVGDPAQALARPDDRELWYCGLVEPNAWGASAIRGEWWRAIEGSLSASV